MITDACSSCQWDLQHVMTLMRYKLGVVYIQKSVTSELLWLRQPEPSKNLL